MDEVQSHKGRSTTMKFNLIGGSLVAEESASTVSECSKGFQRHRGWRAIPKTFKNIVQGQSLIEIVSYCHVCLNLSVSLCLSLSPSFLVTINS